ncbi:hypothetical protein [Mycolicibacterium canariasense]|uniref:hypothetical protein n=1 Tax=Mycolicibacterium canariasense TaxID=228230 RepID=UPI00078773C8|nr:hypothetical protein [Mycolicibacterium canariasense]MCV7213347.1 hypothetical protein [Mycolicibacterium canariasense]ORV10594.1 hypothetical protein AWB94_06715 [Mycolicibacterium canariasense]
MGKQRPVLAGLMATVGVAVLYRAHHRPRTARGVHPCGDHRTWPPTPMTVLDGGRVTDCRKDTGVPDAPAFR